VNQGIEALKALPIFADFGGENLAILTSNSRVRQYPSGHYLYMHGDDIKNFKIVCRGTIQVFRETPDGHEVTSDILIAGDCINADEIIARHTAHMTNARVVDDAMVLEISISWMRLHLKDFDQLAPRLLQGLSERLRESQKEAVHRSTMSATQIVACYLQGLCVLYDFDPQGFDLPYSKTLIASRLHMEPATFSRTLQKLKGVGISVTGNHVAFTNLHKAGHFVCDECSVSAECPTHQALAAV